MKKMLFYVTNTFICAIFLNIRLAFLLFGNADAVSDKHMTLVNVLTAVVGTIMLINIVLSYKEATKKEDTEKVTTN